MDIIALWLRTPHFVYVSIFIVYYWIAEYMRSLNIFYCNIHIIIAQRKYVLNIFYSYKYSVSQC